MPTPDELREKIRRLQQELRHTETSLEFEERMCKHDWTTPEYTPDRTEAYTTPGDPPGTMGVDWRGPVHVPAQITPKWSRRCRTCGKIETTTRADNKITEIPRF